MAFKLKHQNGSPFQQRLQSSSGGTNPEVEAMNKIIAERALANGIPASQPPPSLTQDSGKEDSWLQKLSFAVQNPMTAARMVMGVGQGGSIPSGAQAGLDAGTLERSELDDYALDVINLPGALTKVAEGAVEGDALKVGKGLLYSAPYGKTISKALGGTSKVAKGAYNTATKYKQTAKAIQNKLTPKALKQPVEALLGDDGAKLAAKIAIKKSV
jgi:hypothetical protein